MAVIEIARIQVRRGQENVTGVPQLAGGEFAWAADTEKLYIGLSRDDGGSRDANVEILTENHLRNFFRTLSTATQSTYIYREGTYISAEDRINEFQRTVQEKLDDLDVTIDNFGLVRQGVGDSAVIQYAVDNLFLNSLELSENPNRTLRFPPGTYYLNETIYIPKHTTIIGEGIDRTIFVVASNLEHAFQTADSSSVGSYEGAGTGHVTFDTSPLTITSNGQPSHIHLEGMTIRYDNTLTTVTQTMSMISLDCADHAVIRNVKFEGNYTLGSLVTATNHIGIDIRSYATVSAENVLIDRCEFKNLYCGILSNYDVVNPTIDDSKFSELHKGIVFGDPVDGTASLGPRLAKIKNNRFENIEEQAILVGDPGSTTGTNHISMNNQFINVGNNNILLSEESPTGTAVISFGSKFNRSVNDYFDRYEWQLRNAGSSYDYRPLVEGNISLDLTPGVTVAAVGETKCVLRLPITEENQFITVNYNAYNSTDSRKGVLSINIGSGINPDTSVTDNYTYFSADGNIVWAISKNAAFEYFELTAENQGGSTLTIEHQSNLLT